MIYHTTDSTIAYEPGSSYGTFRDLSSAVLRAIRTVEERLDEFDIIAVQGASGMSIGFPLALAVAKDIVVVRKPGEDNHCGKEEITGTSVEGQRVLFVDDFISGGSTRQRVRNAVERHKGTVVAEYTSREDMMLKS